jgi:hypothetical protein
MIALGVIGIGVGVVSSRPFSIDRFSQAIQGIDTNSSYHLGGLPSKRANIVSAGSTNLILLELSLVLSDCEVS